MLRSNSELSAPCFPATDTVSAILTPRAILLNARHPAAEWSNAAPITFCANWQGENPDPARQTEVRVLWTPATLYLRFLCSYRALFTFSDSDPDGRRFHLWERDVAEAFLQPDPAQTRSYSEFEISPNGMWIDLGIVKRDVFPNDLTDLKSGLMRSVWLDVEARTWAAEMAIPMKALIADFDPNAVWRANFYRIEGPKEPRFYSAWQPTNTPQPDFHVPSAFGQMRFVER